MELGVVIVCMMKGRMSFNDMREGERGSVETKESDPTSIVSEHGKISKLAQM